MKLQNFLIGIGVFALFTVIIFSAIDTNNSKGIYSENFLNITHDSNTSKAIANITTVGKTADSDFHNIKEDMDKVTLDRKAEDATEGNIYKDGINVLMNLPTAYLPVQNVVRMVGERFGIPDSFKDWAVSAIVITLALIVLAAFLKHKLES